MKEHKEKGVDLGLRQFIKSLGYVAGGTALLATTPWLTSCTPEKLQEIKHEKARIALIGTGSRGQYHIHNLKEIPHAQIVAVCDIMPPIFNKHWNFVRMQSHIRITANYWNRRTSMESSYPHH